MNKVFIPDNVGGGTWEAWKDDRDAHRNARDTQTVRRMTELRTSAEALAEALREIKLHVIDESADYNELGRIATEAVARWEEAKQ